MEIEVDTDTSINVMEQASKMEAESQTDLTMVDIENAHNYTLQTQMDKLQVPTRLS